MSEATKPITSASRITDVQQLAARGADRPQRRELARPLGDRDRERVEDDEGADEERDAGEREQEVADELRELDRLEVLGRLLGRRFARCT